MGVPLSRLEALRQLPKQRRRFPSQKKKLLCRAGLRAAAPAPKGDGAGRGHGTVTGSSSITGKELTGRRKCFKNSRGQRRSLCRSFKLIKQQSKSRGDGAAAVPAETGAWGCSTPAATNSWSRGEERSLAPVPRGIPGTAVALGHPPLFLPPAWLESRQGNSFLKPKILLLHLELREKSPWVSSHVVIASVFSLSPSPPV